MAEITVVGTGEEVRECHRILSAAGFEVALEDEDGLTSAVPVLVGELPNAYLTVRRLVDAGRDVLVCNPTLLTPSQIQTLLLNRRPGEALCLSAERIHHPAYRLIAGLIQTGDAAWQPRLARTVMLSSEKPAGPLLDWRAIEAIALLTELIGGEPLSATALEAPASDRGKEDFLAVCVAFERVTATLQVGLGEGLDRRETMLASATRKAYVDELNKSVPVRILDEDSADTTSRWLASSSPPVRDLIRLQVHAFLQAAQQPDLADAEAELWLRALAVWRAARTSISQDGGACPVDASLPEPEAPPSVSTSMLRPMLRIVSG